MEFTPQQAKQINEASYKLGNQHYKFLEMLMKIDRNLAKEYFTSMEKLKLPYIDKSGTLLHLCLPEAGIKYAVSKIPPRIAREIAKHRPVIEAILAGESPETIERLKNSI